MNGRGLDVVVALLNFRPRIVEPLFSVSDVFAPLDLGSDKLKQDGGRNCVILGDLAWE